MNIESFVSESLRQIGAGVQSAHEQPGIKISPQPLRVVGDTTLAGNMVDQASRRVIVLVEFDLSVVVQAKIEGEAAAKLEVIGLNLGGGKVDAGIDQTRTQRIKFHVPVTFPPPKQDT
jgi:hypothetical protein